MTQNSPDRDAAVFPGNVVPQLLDALDRSHYCMFVFSADWHYAYVNQAACAMLRRSRADLLGQNCWELFPELHHNQDARILQRVMRDREPATWSYLSTLLGGWVECYAHPLAEGGVTVTVHGIDARVRVERAHLESERRFQVLADLVPCMIWTANASGQPTWVNQRWVEYSGQTLDQLQRSPDDVLHRDDLAQRMSTFGDAAQTKTVASFEHRLRRHDGAYRWHLARAQPIVEDGGEVAYWLGAATDIQAEREVLSSERSARREAEDTRDHVHRVLSQAPLALAVFLGVEHIIEVSTPSANQLYGCATYGRPARECLRAEVIARGMLKTLDEVYKSGACVVQSGEHVTVPTQAGAGLEERVIDTHYSALKLTSGQVYGVLVASVDVTAQARARQRAEQEQQRLARVLEQAPFAVAITVGPEHVLRSANARQLQMFGQRATLNMPARVAFPEEALEPIHAVFDRAFFENETIIMREQRIGWSRASSGVVEFGYFDLFYQPIVDASGKVEGLLCVSTEVTDQVEQRRHIEELREQAEAARNTLALAHAQLELRIAERTSELARSNNALAAEIAARNDLQRRLHSAREDEQRRTARDLHDQVGQTLSALTLTIKAACEADTLPPAALGRLEDALRLAGNLSRDIHELATRLRPAVLDAFGLYAALRQLLADWSRQLDIKVDFEGEWIKDVRFAADIEIVLYRVAQEALTNVARHANAKHVSMIVELNAGDIIAVVEDDGRGFDASVPALGRMGLESMRERATLVGGTFDVESIPGVGTTVIVSIPVGGSVS